ncbi:MAG: Hpt domain-containing protein [Rickettsiaceae bacterium]|nr:Hpt domain-containing protein [Rickettsiaceae bacterium]
MNDDPEVINMSTVMEAQDVMGEERFASLVEYFLKDSETYISEIEASLEEENIKGIIAPAHTIKSSAKQLGAERVSLVAEQIEEKCRNFLEKSEVETTKAEIITESNIMCEELRSELEAAAEELTEICQQGF